MNKIQAERLLKLAQHLETGKLGHKRFSFDLINSGKVDKSGCGTVGCAMGELPIVFPRTWEFISLREVAVRGSDRADGMNMEFSVQEWFGISRDERRHLFYPLHQHPDLYGGRMLVQGARKTSVAKNIRLFVEKKKGNK